MNFFKKYGLKEDEDQYKVKEILLDTNANVKSILKNIIKLEKELTKKNIPINGVKEIGKEEQITL